MRRPTRTRRMSIAAIASCVAFLAVAAAYTHGIPTEYEQNGPKGHAIAFYDGSVFYVCGTLLSQVSEFHLAFEIPPTMDREALYSTNWRLLGFSYRHADTPIFEGSGIRYEVSIFGAPLWPLIVLLIIAPVLWLVARDASDPAFPVIIDVKQLK